MIIIKKIFSIILLLIMVSGCSQNEEIYGTSESFVYDKMIIFKGNVYVSTSQEIIEIEEQVGSIKHHVTKEEDSDSESSSNFHPVGTKLYKIPNVDIEDALAVEISNNKYIRAINPLALH